MATIARVMYDVVARDGASRTFRRIGDDSAYAESRVAKFGRSFALAGGVVAAAAVAIGVESVRMATTFQAQMTRIQTQAGGSAKDVRELTGAVLHLASSRAEQGPQQLAASLYHLKSVGMDNVHAMKALRAASDLAAVGGADLEQTTNALAGAWRSGIKGAGTFAKAGAAVNAIIGAGNMTMEDFVQSLSSGILPAARTFGVSLKSVGSAMALMTDEGIPAEVAATRLRMTLSLLGAPTQKAADQLKTIGLTGTALAKTMRGPGGLVAAVQLLHDHIQSSGLTAVQASQLISRAFGGGRSASAIETLLNNLDVLRKKQDQINAGISKYGSDVAAQRKTAGAEFDRLRAIIDAVGIRIGLALLPPVTSFVSFIVNRAIPAVARFGGRVSAVFNAIIPVGAIKSDWDNLMRWLGVAKPKPVKLYSGDLIHMPRPVPLYAGDLIHAKPMAPLDLLHPLPKSAGDQIAGPIVSGIRRALSGPNIGQALGSALGIAAAGLTKHLTLFVSNLVQALAGLDWVNIGKAVGGNALGFAIGFVSNLGADLFSPSFWEHHWLDVIMAAIAVTGLGKIGGLIARILEHIPILRAFAPLFRGIEKIGAPVFDAAYGAIKRIGAAFLRGMSDEFPRTFGVLNKWLGLLPIRLGVWALQIFDRGRKALIGLGTGILKGAEGFGRIIGRIIKMITSPFARAGSWLVSNGMDIVRGLLTGIRRFMAGIGSWVKSNIVDPLVNAVKHFFGIRSPSTVMAGLGGHLIGGLLRGMVAGSKGLVHAVFGSFPAALGHLVEKGFASIASLPGRALRALGGLGSSVLGKLGGLLGFGGGSGVAQWGSTVSKVLGMLGLPAVYKDMWLRQIATESGGNRFAINLTDSNARAGDPSRGVLQTIMSTFNAYAGPFRGLGIYNGLANIYAGINYALHRYGRIGMLGVIGHGHGYWQGGPITEPILGVGKSGRSYRFGEDGLQEWVTRGRPGGRGVNDGLTRGPLVHVEQMVVQDATDAELVARKLAFRVTAASFGGNG